MDRCVECQMEIFGECKLPSETEKRNQGIEKALPIVIGDKYAT